MSDIQHSVANQGEADDGRLFAPAAARNADAILTTLTPHLPSSGYALEVASGTGEHVIALAKACPDLIWQPTDIDDERLESIAAWIAHSGLPNVAPPLYYNAVETTWPGPPMGAVFLSNLTHLISEGAAKTMLAHIAGALASGGLLAIYGPFKRGTNYASEGDARFDASIRAERPEAGYKDIGWVEAELLGHNLMKHDTLAMPANNLMTLWRAPQ
ncbi:MAG: DUF938 domain-containing protein [Hyphomicrobiales bacterium]